MAVQFFLPVETDDSGKDFFEHLSFFSAFFWPSFSGVILIGGSYYYIVIWVPVWWKEHILVVGMIPIRWITKTVPVFLFSPLSKRIALLSTGSPLKSPDELGVLVGIFHCIEQRLKFGIHDLWDYKVERGTGRGSCTLVWFSTKASFAGPIYPNFIIPSLDSSVIQV